MKKIGLIITLFAFLFSHNAFTQEVKTKEQKKIEKQRLKDSKQKKAEAEWYQLKQIIDDSTFVFSGNQFDGITLDPRINFVIINKESVTIQFADGFGGGQNGIGGFTVEGQLEKYVVKTTKPGKAININFSVMPKVGQGVGGLININLSAFSYDSARFSIGSRAGVMQGSIQSPADSRVFKGNTPN